MAAHNSNRRPPTPGGAARNRAARGGRLALIAFVAVLAGLWVAAATAVAGGGGSGGTGTTSSTIQITECPSGSTTTTSGSSCQQTSATVAPTPSKTTPSTKPGSSSGSKPPGGSEVHSYSLGTGHGTVTTAGGKRYGDTAKVQVSPTAVTPTTPTVPKPHPSAPSKTATPPAQPTVSTTGGGGFAGFAGGFGGLSLVTADQALSQFEIPSFLLPIYLAAGRTYGIPWPVLAGINKIESDFGRNMSTSSAGAVGWMQFMPGTWKGYAVDANGDGYADPYDPADAIFAAARYLHNAGASTNLRQAIFAYNHAGWYVDEVLQTAAVYGSLPPGLIGETGSLTYGRFPLLGPASYGDDFRLAQLAGRRPQPLQITGRGGATAVATQQVKVSRILLDPALAADLKLHGALGGAPATAVAPAADVPSTPAADLPRTAPASAPAPTAGASTASVPPAPVPGPAGPLLSAAQAVVSDTTAAVGALVGQPAVAVPAPSGAAAVAAPAEPGHALAELPQGFGVSHTPGITVIVTDADGNQYRYGGLAAVPAYVRPGAQLSGGEALGTLPAGAAASLAFSVTASGNVPVDPRPLVDGYRLQEAIHFYRAVAPFGANPFVPQTASTQYGGYVSPFQGYTPIAERIDMGVDYSAPPGSPLVAIGPGRVIGLSPNWYAGQPLVDYQITSGPLHGVDVYYAEQLTPMVSAGQSIAAGQVIARVASSGTGLELGFGTSVPGQTLAQVTGGYGEGALTAAGQAFSNLMLELGAPAGLAEGRSAVGDPINMPSLAGVHAAHGVVASTAQPASAAQEAAISRALDRISNPKLAKPSPFAIPVSHSPATGHSGHGPAALRMIPSAAGAQLSAITTAGGGRSWAIGTVDGALRSGWAKSQTVLLSFAGGTWSLIGPPRDASGRVANPRLRALSVASDGSGYAVGDRGAVVALGPGRAPRLLETSSGSRLAAVAATTSASGLSGVAVGDRGSILELAGDAVARRSRAPGQPDLASVTIGRDGALIAGNGPSGPVLMHDAAGVIQPQSLSLGLPTGTGVRLSSVAERGGQVWLAGGLLDPTGVGAETPLAARSTGSGWDTFCASGPAVAGVVEVGQPTPSVCHATLPIGAHSGAASAVALTTPGALLATPDGLLQAPADGASFVPATPAACTPCDRPVSALALSSGRSGWALDGTGALSQVSSGLAERGEAAPLRSASGRTVTPPGAALRRLALPGSDRGWAISETGGLLRYLGGRWSAAGSGSLRALASVSHSLGAAPLSSERQPLQVGLNGLTFAPGGHGYAVGGDGVILDYDGSAWRPQSSGVTRTLTDVAAAGPDAVAVGQQGTLLERSGGHWSRSTQAWSLVGAHDLEAAAALPDGTLLAAGSGSVIARSPGSPTWAAAPVAPLGVAPLRLAAYRDGARHLHVLALVSSGSAEVVLDGTATGWRPLPVPAAMNVSDLEADAGGTRATLIGQQDGKPVAFALPLADGVIPSSLAGVGGGPR